MKKKIFKIAVALICVLVAYGIFQNFNYEDAEKINAYFSSFAFDEDFDASNQPYSMHNYNELSAVEKQAYICIFNNIASHPDYIKIPNLTSEEFNRVYFAVKNDNPNMLCFNESCSMLEFFNSCLIQLSYEHNSDECKSMQTQLMQTVRFIVDEMPEFNDDYSKELYIHDYIVQNCVYKESQSASTAYSCLIDGFAVCSGYSRATMLLLNEAGIDSMLIAGTGESSSQGAVSHMWNLVWIEGEPYHLDVTWDDPVTESTDVISHLYFNLTDTEISADHSDYKVFYECTARTYNYFVNNNLSFDLYGQNVLDTIKLKLANNINNGRYYIEFTFDNDDAYKTAQSRLIDDTSTHSDIYDLLDYISRYAADKVDKTHINFACDDNKNYIRMMFDIL
ncbi:MAG: hypothetical protein IJZ35_03645 [Clostridia bacterium]|nr:hypothetical protein [Clostridia bacterium]